MREIEFPQPSTDGAYKVYGISFSTLKQVDQFIDWMNQEIKKRQIPKWFLDLGPEPEYYHPINEWQPVGTICKYVNWAEEKPEDYRAKPKPETIPLNTFIFYYRGQLSSAKADAIRKMVNEQILRNL